jgi:SAM-dependent methyltransferase
MDKPENIENTDNTVSLDQYLSSIENDLNDLIMDPGTNGYTSLQEQDISYGISVSVGIDPVHDTVLDLGSGIGEFFSYVERFTGNRLYKYIAVDNDEKTLDILKFRYGNDQTIVTMGMNYRDFVDAHKDYNSSAIKNLQIMGFDSKIDWVVSCNGLDDTMGETEIFDIIKTWSSVAEKGAVFTFKMENALKFINIIQKILTYDELATKIIIRSDFDKNWYSLYIYNQRA